MRLNDKRSLGDLPLQDHRLDVDVELRNVLSAYRVESRDKFNRWRAQGHAGSTHPQRTIGDIQSAFFIPPLGNRRRIGSWSFGLPTRMKDAAPPPRGTTTGPRLADLDPIRLSDWTLDNRYKVDGAIDPAAPGLPKGQPGILLGATEERTQQTVFLPTSVPLIAPNKDGDPAIGSPVYDLTDEDEIDARRFARLQTAWRVIKKGALCPGDKPHDALGWQLGKTGRKALPCYGLTVEAGSPPGKPPKKAKTVIVLRDPRGFVFGAPVAAPGVPAPPPPDYVVGFAGKGRSGPLDNARFRREHLLGTDDLGNPIAPTGLAVEALWRDSEGHDAPLAFEVKTPYKKTSSYDFLTPAHIRHDEPIPHKWVCGDAPGLWRIQAEVPFLIGDGDPLPPEPEDFIPPWFDPKKAGEDHVFDPQPEDGTATEREAARILVDDPDGLRREILGGPTKKLPSFPAQVRFGGGLMFRAFATAARDHDMACGTVASTRDLNDFIRAPDVAALVPVGRGTGRWSGFDVLDDGEGSGARRAAGGICLLPAREACPRGLADVMAGRYDPNVDDETPETQASLFIPAGLASIDFARPTGGLITSRGLAGERTGAGIRAHQTLRGLALQGLDGSGAEIASQSWALGTEGDVLHQRNGSGAGSGVVHELVTSQAAARIRAFTSEGTIAAPTVLGAGTISKDILSIEAAGQTAASTQTTVASFVARATKLLLGSADSEWRITTQENGSNHLSRFTAAGGLDLFEALSMFGSGGANKMTLAGTMTGARTATFQDASGTLAYTSDIQALTVTASSGTFAGVAGALHLVDTSGGVGTCNLPAASGSSGRLIVIKDKGNAATNNITINRAGSDTIQGDASISITADYGLVRLRSDGVNTWYLMG